MLQANLFDRYGGTAKPSAIALALTEFPLCVLLLTPSPRPPAAAIAPVTIKIYKKLHCYQQANSRMTFPGMAQGTKGARHRPSRGGSCLFYGGRGAAPPQGTEGTLHLQGMDGGRCLLLRVNGTFQGMDENTLVSVSSSIQFHDCIYPCHH